MLTPQWLDALRARITLSAVIGRSVRLQKAGREFRACCPFHDEKSPSFYVNDAKGFYHCFGCQAHGDAIRWLTDHQGLPFMDAVKELAAEAGMEVPAPDPRAARQAEKRASLTDVTAAAQEWFVGKLGASDGAEARAYLERRGISQSTAREFGFGYAPDERQALKSALGQFDEGMLVESGMRITPEDGGRDNYDRFRGRLMLPIQDARGRVIAFGGRTLAKDAGGAKYLNSPDTPLFDKGRTLYNLHRAAPAARKAGRIVVVEGYMDVIALAQAGIVEAVAPMGTALTEHQLELLWRQVERPILCFDGDAAGQRAALKAIARALPLLQPGRSLNFVDLPNGKDPDEFLREFGTEQFLKILEKPLGMPSKIWRAEFGAVALESADDKALLRERLIEHAFAIRHPELQRLYRKELLENYYSTLYEDSFSKRRADHGKFKTVAVNALQNFVKRGQREILLNAVFIALSKNPVLIEEFLPFLYAYNPADDIVLFCLAVFSEAAEARIDGNEMPEDALNRIAQLPCAIPFPFTKNDAPEDVVRDGVREALAILIERPKLERRLKEATKQYAVEITDENAKFQAHIRSELDGLKFRLIDFARRQGIATSAMQFA